MTDNQLTRDQLADMSPDAIEKARLEGRLDRILGATEETIAAKAAAREADRLLTRADLAAMSRAGLHDDIARAYSEGRVTTEQENHS